MNIEDLEQAVNRLADADRPRREAVLPVIDALFDALEGGQIRTVEPGDSGWRVHAWVKRGILLAFRVGSNQASGAPPVFHFRDRETLPTWNPNRVSRNVRIVPGGTVVRRGAYLGEDTVVMPPAYVNVGAFIGRESMIDSHALVGSCAQIGCRVHLSAAAQIGGVLEPVGAMPVIVEDDVFVGGGCGIYEGTRVRAGAVLAPGVILTRAVPLYDLVHETVIRAERGQPLEVPENAVIVPGGRPAPGGFAEEHGLVLQTPVIVKYRNRSTDSSLVLEQALR